MKVENFTSNSGNKCTNQFIIVTNEGRMFQSYRSNIAFRANDGQITLGRDWGHSKTTGKYRNEFLGETMEETQKKLDSGVYKYDKNL